jgi:hypothetical protein
MGNHSTTHNHHPVLGGGFFRRQDFSGRCCRSPPPVAGCRQSPPAAACHHPWEGARGAGAGRDLLEVSGGMPQLIGAGASLLPCAHPREIGQNAPSRTARRRHTGSAPANRRRPKLFPATPTPKLRAKFISGKIRPGKKLAGESWPTFAVRRGACRPFSAPHPTRALSTWPQTWQEGRTGHGRAYPPLSPPSPAHTSPPPIKMRRAGRRPPTDRADCRTTDDPRPTMDHLIAKSCGDFLHADFFAGMVWPPPTATTAADRRYRPSRPSSPPTTTSSKLRRFVAR